jgi:hypothetical protein
MTFGCRREVGIPAFGPAAWSAKLAIALTSLLMAQCAEAADVALPTCRVMRPQAFRTGVRPPSCVSCSLACRRNGGPLETVCEALCQEACGVK